MAYTKDSGVLTSWVRLTKHSPVDLGTAFTQLVDIPSD